MKVENRNEDFPIVPEAAQEVVPFWRPLLKSIKRFPQALATKSEEIGENYPRLLRCGMEKGYYGTIALAGWVHIIRGGDVFKTSAGVAGVMIIAYCAMKIAQGLEEEDAISSNPNLETS